MKADLLTVVAKFREDVSWTGKLNCPYIIYNKNRDDDGKYKHNLPNDSREAHTFMHHIIENYKNLNEYTAFVQGNPFDHCPATLEILNNFEGKEKSIALGRKWCQDHHKELHVDIEMLKFARSVPMAIKFPVYISPGGQFLVHRDLILSRPIEFYKKIFSLLVSPEPVGRQSLWDVEKTTLQIFNVYEPDRWGC